MADEESTSASTTASITSEHSNDCGSDINDVAEETNMSSTSSQSSSDDTVQGPTAPANTPESQSDAGEGPSTPPPGGFPDLAAAVAALNLQAGPAPSTTTTSSDQNPEDGKAHLRGPIRSELSLHNQLFKAPPPKPLKVKRKKHKVTYNRATGIYENAPTRRRGDESPPNEHVHEHSTWVHIAKQDFERGLQRVAMAAKDEARINGAKTAEEVYSELVAEMLKKGEFKFDPKFLE